VLTKGSWIATDHIDLCSHYELLVDGDPPRVVAIGQQLEGGQTIHGAPLFPRTRI